MKKPVVGLALGLFALLFMLSSAAWAVSANEHYQVNDDVQSDLTQITLGNLLSSNEDNKQTLYTPLNGGAADGQWLDFVEAWQLAAEQGGAVTLQQDVLVAADVPEGIFVHVPEDGQVLLNLNGYRLIGEEAPCLIFVGARGKLTVTDSEQGGGQIVGVVGVDDSAENENEWGQIELLGGEIVDPNVAVLADDEAEYTPVGGTAETGTFEAMWNKAATGGGKVKLLKSISAKNISTNGYILVPQNVTITLDLDHHQFDNNKTHAIRVEGTLNVLNGSETYDEAKQTLGGIVYCSSASDGGGIYVAGTGKLNWFGGRLQLNESKTNGGAVYLEDGAYFEMHQGYINGCAANTNGGAVYVNSGATFSIGGQVEIEGNTRTYPNISTKSNVYLAAGQKININSALDDNVEIWVTTENKPTTGNPVLIASRAVGSSVPAFINADNFKSDDDLYETFVWSGDIGLKVKGDVITDPQAEYTKDGTTQKGTFVDMWNKAATGGGTVKLLKDVTADSDGAFGTGVGFGDGNRNGYVGKKGYLLVPESINITLNLNGCTLNRALYSSSASERDAIIGGEVIEVKGELTINDDKGNGIIKGGIGTLAGCILVEGTLKMNGGNITENAVFDAAIGAVTILPAATFEMNGGSITGNDCSGNSNAGGVFVFPNANFKVSGNVNVTENGSRNVYLDNDEGRKDIPKIIISGQLANTSKIGVTAADFSSTQNSVAIATSANTNFLDTDIIVADDSALYHTEVQGNNIMLVKGATLASHKHALNIGCDESITTGATEIEFDKKLSTDTSGRLLIDGVAQSTQTVSQYSGGSITAYTLSPGSYYLVDDLLLNNPIAFNAEGTVNLCLNGHKVTYKNTSSYSLFYLMPKSKVELNLADCSSDKAGLITGGNASAEKFKSGGGIYIDCGTLNMYGGNIVQNAAAEKGGGVYIDHTSNGTLNMYGGSIDNNEAVKGGGGVYNSGTFILNGGKIINNTTQGNGGGVYNSLKVFEMTGGEISSNVADGLGAGLVLQGSGTYSISGGLIKNNITNKSGAGGIYLLSADLKMTGGRIVNNKALANNGAGILVSSSSNLYLSGGEITGNAAQVGAGIYVDNDTSNMYISGAPKVYGNKNGDLDSNVYLTAGKVIQIESGKSLTDGAYLGVTKQIAPTAENSVAITNEVDSSYAKYFVADESDKYNIKWNETDRKLYLIDGATPTHTHNDITYSPWVLFTNPLPAGNYYLTSDITLTDTITIEGDVNICLNGHKITGPADKPAFKVPDGSTLNIYNDEGADFSGLSDSGGIEVAGGGTLNMIAKDSADNVTYAPAAGSQGGKVTVDNNGIVTKPSEGGEEPTPGETHAERHHELAAATPLTADSIKQHIKSYEESGYTGTLPDVKSAYDFLDQGTYYMEEDFTLNKALVVLKDTTYCLNGNNFGADNETWLYELGHVFWVPEKAVLNVLDCQRNLHIIWLYGGRVFLKDGGAVNMTDKDGWQTIIESTDPEGGFVKVEQDKNGNIIMTLPDNTKLTQKDDKNEITQTITNNNGVLEITTPQAEAPTKITPPSADASIDLKLPEAQPGEEPTPDIVLDVPADSIVQTGEGPEIKLEQPGEVAADGTVSSPEVTVTITDPETKEEVQTTITAPAGKDVQVNTDGQAQAPVDSTVKVDDVVVKIEEIGGGDGDEPDKVATVSPNGDVQLPPGKGSQVTVSSPEKGDVTIVIALPDNGGEIGLGSGDGVGGGSITPPKDSDVTVKNKDDVTIVIALPWPEDGKPPHIDFGNGGTLILPPGTEIKVDGKDPVTVDKDNPVFNPETGELTDKEPENKPSEPVNPNEPTGETEDLTPDKPVETPDAKVEMDDKGEITITPTNPEKPAVVIKPQPQDPDKPGATPKPPVVDETGKVFIDDPFKVETENGPDITADKGGSVDPDGNVTGEKVTVEQKNPDGTENKTTLIAPDNDAVKVSPEGEAQAPVGTEVENEDVTVKIDKVPDPTKPVTVKPDGSINLPGGSEITVTPQQPEKNYTVKLPEQGGEVKLNPDKTITLPPGSKVVDQNGKETTISNNGGTLNPSTGAITGAVTGGSSSGGGGGGSSSASYVITASASIGGEISPDKRVVVSRGADQTFTIKPADGYVISDVLVDGKSVGQVTSYTFENVRAGHSIQALFVAKGMFGHGHQGDCPKDETCPIWPYSDSIPTAWYHDGVHYCIEYDLMIGTAPALWEPNIPFSRAMMAQVLYNKAGRPAVSGEGVFDDVDQEWYWPAITWGGRNKVLWGYGDGNYGPEDPITREQLATLLWRYAGQPETSAQLSFTDAAQTSDYAKQALAWASQHGVITGYPDGTFQPQGYTSRAEAAQMIMRYFNL